MTNAILFVCLGNICRSPTAEAIFRVQAEGRGLEIDSAGTSGWHDGNPSDVRASAEAARRGIDMSYIRSRKVVAADFERFDLIVAMDAQNLRDLQAVQPVGSLAKLVKLLDYAPEIGLSDVPDPYYEDNFPEVLNMIEHACGKLLEAL
ncbi:MAG TPA: low molecular weight phosphotyrosine protein phosphatase [Rhodobacteraceae bacterium]|nr:low molecular weight phosphotyrosine protein phosphatase [Paracoccaceae bacterium]